MRALRKLVAVIVASLAVALAVAAPASALEILPQRTLTFKVPLTGTAKPYTLAMTVRDTGASADVQVNLTRKATTGNRPTQQHSFYVNTAAFACTGGGQRCTLDTGTNMGSYGRINLVFNATSAALPSHHACPNNYHKENAQAKRTGRVTGSFQLVTGTAYFGTIENHHSAPVHIPASIKAQTDKITYGSACTGPTPKCERQVFAGIQGGTQGTISADQFTSSGVGSALWDINDATVTPDVTVVHRVFVHAHTKVLKVTSNSPSLSTVAVKLPFAPFLTGHGTFTGSGSPSTVTYPSCRETNRDGTFSGVFTAVLDGWGQFHSSGPLTTSATRYVPH